VKKLRFLFVGLLVFGVSGCGADSSIPIYKVIYTSDIQNDNIANFQKYTFCSQDEKIVFSCELENKKTVSLCGKEKYLKYAYGKNGQIPEFTINGDSSIFNSGISHQYIGATVLNYIGFRNYKYRYSIYQIDGTGIRRLGLVVHENNQKIVLSQECISHVVTDNRKLWTVGLSNYDFLNPYKLLNDKDISENGLYY